jgi:integrase
MSKSTSSRASRKAPDRPKKPYPDFPLTPHPTGTWQKKIRGRIYYFGKWAKRVDGKLERVPGDGWEDALAEYKKVADDLHAGRTPRVSKGGLTVADLCNRFLTAKLRKVEAGEMSTTLFADYKLITDLLVANFGANRLVDDLASDDFAQLRALMAKRWGPVRLGNSVTRTKSVFKYGYDSGAMDRPVRYGPEFAKPDKATLRKHRARQPRKMFAPEEVRALIDGAAVVGECGPMAVEPSAALRAMILLGVNCGFGNTDCASLTFTGTDLTGGWIDFPRPKTGVARRCALWPETVEAIRAATAESVRPKPADFSDCGRVFLTGRGTACVIQTKTGNKKDVVGVRFTAHLKALGIHRKGVGFYTLRHVFETVAGGAKDQVAVDAVMGHADPTMAAHYREGIEDERLRAVASHVRKWLWPE